MDLPDLRSALASHFAGYTAEPDSALDLVLAKSVERRGFALCPDREDGMANLGAFEAAMQRLVDARNAHGDSLHLGLVLAFAATAAGQHPSYRRALKKYSNSIVFEDLGISLYLVKGENDLIILAPAEVNSFLRDLDQWIAKQHKDR